MMMTMITMVMMLLMRIDDLFMMICSLSFTGVEVFYRHGILRDIDPECNSTKCKELEYASIIGVCR
jgi:hypothetical protein